MYTAKIHLYVIDTIPIQGLFDVKFYEKYFEILWKASAEENSSKEI